jgi:protein O-GlcNAc transferase
VNPQMRELQGEAARKAVEVDPTLAVAQARLGQYYYHIQEYAKGDEHMRKAAALDQDDPLVLGFAASDAIWRGDYALAASLWRKIVAQDPLSPISRGNYGFMLLANGQPEEALAEYRRALELNPNAGPNLHVSIARTLVQLERYQEALNVTDEIPEGPERDFILALLHRAPGRARESDAALERLAAAPLKVANQVHLAEVYADRGRTDDAFQVLIEFNRKLTRERGQKPRDWWWFQDEIRMAPLLRGLHGDPRWATLTADPG